MLSKQKEQGKYESVSVQRVTTLEISDGGKKKDDKNDDENLRSYINITISYKWLMWIMIIFCNVIAVIDRFTSNVWPMWVDSPGPTIANNFPISCFTLIAWSSSRILLMSSSFIFWLQCNVFWNWFLERYHKKNNFCFFKLFKLYIGDILETNHKIHYYVGIYLIGIPLLLHVWVIVFASIFGTKLNIFDSWWRPWINGVEVSFIDQENNVLNLSINDVYRICTSTLTFIILMPISMFTFCKNRNWSTMQYIHLFGGLIYTVDLLRMYSHPHCWFINIPFILCWMIDRILGIKYYRKYKNVIIQKKNVLSDGKYMILYLKMNGVENKNFIVNNNWIGDIWYLNTRQGCKNWDRAHPFTVFTNHYKKVLTNTHKQSEWTMINDAGYKDLKNKFLIDLDENTMIRKNTSSINEEFYIENKNDDEADIENDDDNNWDIGIVAQIFERHDGFCCDNRTPWTNYVSSLLPESESDSNLVCYGPYRSEYRLLFVPDLDLLGPVILIGTGAGCSFMIDFYNYFTSLMAINNDYKLRNKIEFYFSTRSVELFQWFTNITCHVNINDNKFMVNAHLTSHDDVSYVINDNDNGGNNNGSLSKTNGKSRDAVIGRLSFEEMLNRASNDCRVFFCGSPVIQKKVDKLCNKLDLEFVSGHSFYT